MTDEPQIVIAGTRTDWPGGPRTLTPRDACLEPNRRTFWFGADLAPDGSQVWFRIALDAVRRMPEPTPGARGDRLIASAGTSMRPDCPDLPGYLKIFEFIGACGQGPSAVGADVGVVGAADPYIATA